MTAGNTLHLLRQNPGRSPRVTELPPKHRQTFIKRWHNSLLAAMKHWEAWMLDDKPVNSPVWEREAKKADDAWKTLAKYIPDAPKEVEVQGQVNHAVLIHELKSLESKYPEHSIDCETQGSGVSGSFKHLSTSGNKTPALPGTELDSTNPRGTESQEQSATVEEKVGSSPVLDQSTLERLKTPE